MPKGSQREHHFGGAWDPILTHPHVCGAWHLKCQASKASLAGELSVSAPGSSLDLFGLEGSLLGRRRDLFIEKPLVDAEGEKASNRFTGPDLGAQLNH